MGVLEWGVKGVAGFRTDVNGKDWQALRERALTLDASDPLRSMRDRFYLPQGIYLDGNSLGLLSIDAEQAVLGVLETWKHSGIDGWSSEPDPWFSMAESCAKGVATLIGAKPSEVAVTGSTTSNLHHLLATLHKPRAGKRRVLIDALNFPTDVYAIKAHVANQGGDPERDIVWVDSRDGHLSIDDLLTQMRDDVGLAFFSSVLYQSGQRLPIAPIAARARSQGILLGVDLSHSIGAMPHALHDDQVDFAVWCHYKYLSAGPGAVAGLFIHERHHAVPPAFPGWWGSDKTRQFDMAPSFARARGAGAFQQGRPHMLSLAGLAGVLPLFLDIGIDRIREKSLALTDLLMEGLEQLGALYPELQIGTPRAAEARGGHVALLHPHADRIAKALKEHGVTPDFRPPNIVRLAPVALYTQFADLVTTLEVLDRILRERLYEAHDAGRNVIA